jgi:hypothetical protein
MYTSMMLLALMGSGAPGEAIPSAPAWMTDYRIACREVSKQKRPLAVVLAAGPEGWDKISKEGELGKEARSLLTKNYLCVYVDTTTERGRQLAEQFELPDGRGLVISDATGEKQAFWHAGSLNNRDLEHYLRKYSDTDRVVVATETTAAPAAAAPAAPPVYAPSYAPTFGGSFGGRSGGC